MGINRSKTAEILFKATTEHEIKSAGTSIGSIYMVTKELLTWADLIFVMELEHLEALREIKTKGRAKSVFVLNIPDVYQFMDAGLIEILSDRLAECYPELFFKLS